MNQINNLPNTKNAMSEIKTNAIIVEQDNQNNIYDDLEKENAQKLKLDEIETLEADEDLSIPDKIINFFKNLFGLNKEEENTKNGRIEFTQQRENGDCWLVSGVNALSFSARGRQMLKNTLEYKDGLTTVHLKGVGDYDVTDDELEAAKEDTRYSLGDDDMVILELAIEKVMDKVHNKELGFDYTYFTNYEEQNPDGLSTYGGFIENTIYLITGKSSIKTDDKEEMAKLLDEFSKSETKDFVLGAAIKKTGSEKIKACDIEGKEIELSSPHAYSIKYANDDTVTVINPWNSAEELVFSKETFLETFDDVSSCDLSDKNPSQNHSVVPKINKDGSKEFVLDCSKKDFHTTSGEIVNFQKVIKTYSKENNPIKEEYYKSDGEIGLVREFELVDGKYEPKSVFSDF